MKRKTHVVLIFLSLPFIGISTPSTSELLERIERLENDLGEYRYLRLNPKIEVVVKSRGVRNSSAKSEDKEYFISGMIRLKEDFPVDRFGMSVTYRITPENGPSYDGVIVVDEFIGESVGFESIPFMQVPEDRNLDAEHAIQVVAANWWPIREMTIELIDERGD